jgi:hypothetical protein
VAELKAKREEARAQGTQGGGEEWLRLDTEVKELHESMDKQLAESAEKQNAVLSILLRIESQQTKSKERE